MIGASKILGWTAALALIAALSCFPKSRAVQLSVHPMQPLRGDLTQARYRIHAKRLYDYYLSLVSGLQTDGLTDLLTKVEPPKDVQVGYQILPKILADDRPQEPRSPIVGYSWAWTDWLIEDATREIARSETALAHIRELDRRARRQMYEELAFDYRKSRSRLQNIDAHIQYNRFWQAMIAANRVRFDRESQLFSLVLERDAIRDF